MLDAEHLVEACAELALAKILGSSRTLTDAAAAALDEILARAGPVDVDLVDDVDRAAMIDLIAARMNDSLYAKRMIGGARIKDQGQDDKMVGRWEVI